MTRSEKKAVAAGTSPEVEFKIGNKAVVILEINAGFGTEKNGNIKAALIAKRTNEDWDSYFASGPVIPSLGGNHASIYSWKGVKFWNGNDYTFKVVGKVFTSDTMYVDIVIDEEVEKYLSAGSVIAGQYVADILGELDDNFADDVSGTTKKFEVPAGEFWLAYGGRTERDASATLNIQLYNENDKVLLNLESLGAGTSMIHWGCLGAKSTEAQMTPQPIPMKAGWYIQYEYGAAQTSDEVSLIVRKFKV